MLAVLLILVALFIIGISFHLSKQNKKARINVGLMMIAFSIFSYPILVPVFAEWKGLEGTASLILFNLLLLIGGIITLIAGFFTKSLTIGRDQSNK